MNGLVREMSVTVGVSGAVFFFSAPVRGELADQIATRTLIGIDCWARDLLVPEWISLVMWQPIACLITAIAFTLFVVLLAAILQTVSQMQRYMFNAVIERRFAVMPMRFHFVACALPLTLGIAITSQGVAGLLAVGLFVVLFVIMRLTVGGQYEVIVQPPADQKNRRETEARLGRSSIAVPLKP